MRQRTRTIYKNLTAALLTAVLLLSASTDAMAQMTMKGVIMGPNKDPLAAALIYIRGTKVATLTNTMGSYELTIPEQYADSTVIVSFDGYDQEELRPTDGIVNIVMNHDTSEEEIQEIYVTTQKRRQTNTEVPIAIGVVEKSKEDMLGINDLEDVSHYVPGFLSTIQCCPVVNNVIRGVSSDGGDSYFQPRISVYLDGVSITRMATSNIALFDMERVEIVKGPQGTLFGLGAENGAISYITQKPKKEFEGSASVNYGAYNQRGADLMLNMPFSEKVQDRIAIHYDAHDGYYRNYNGDAPDSTMCKYNGVRLNGKNAIAIRNSLKFTPNRNTWMNLTIDYQIDREPATMYKCPIYSTLDTWNNYSPYTYASSNNEDGLKADRNTGGVNFDFNHKLGKHLDLQSISGFRAFNSTEVYDADGTYIPLLSITETIEGYQASEELKLNWDNGKKLRGFIGGSFFYEDYTHSYNIQDNLQYMFPVLISPSLRTKFEIIPDQLAEGVSQGIEKFAQTMAMSVSGEYSDLIQTLMQSVCDKCKATIKANLTTQVESWFSSNRWTSTPNFYEDTQTIVEEAVLDALNDVFDQYPIEAISGYSAQQIVGMMDIGSQISDLRDYSNQMLSEDYSENETDYFKTTEGDIFADLTWNFKKKWFLTFGIRGTYEKHKSGYMSTSMSAPIVNTMVYASSNGETVWADQSELSCVGRLAINYMLNSTNNIYASVARGRRPGTLYFNASPDKLVTLDPETIINYEIGVKGNHNANRLNYSLSTYFYQWLKFQTYVSASATDGTKTWESNNDGKAHCLGLEASIKYYFPKILTLTADYALCDSKFNKTDMQGLDQKFSDRDIYEKDNMFRLTPMHSGDLIADCEFPVNDKKTTLYICPSISFQSEMYFDNDNTIMVTEDYPLKEDGYMLLNVTAGVIWKTKDARYNIGIYGKNLTNTEYIIDAGNAGSSIGFSTFIPGAPLTAGVRFKVEF